jgi:hypothetical protein
MNDRVGPHNPIYTSSCHHHHLLPGKQKKSIVMNIVLHSQHKRRADALPEDVPAVKHARPSPPIIRSRRGLELSKLSTPLKKLHPWFGHFVEPSTANRILDQPQHSVARFAVEVSFCNILMRLFTTMTRRQALPDWLRVTEEHVVRSFFPLAKVLLQQESDDEDEPMAAADTKKNEEEEEDKDSFWSALRYCIVSPHKTMKNKVEFQADVKQALKQIQRFLQSPDVSIDKVKDARAKLKLPATEPLLVPEKPDEEEEEEEAVEGKDEKKKKKKTKEGEKASAKDHWAPRGLLVGLQTWLELFMKVADRSRNELMPPPAQLNVDAKAGKVVVQNPGSTAGNLYFNRVGEMQRHMYHFFLWLVFGPHDKQRLRDIKANFRACYRIFDQTHGIHELAFVSAAGVRALRSSSQAYFNWYRFHCQVSMHHDDNPITRLLGIFHLYAIDVSPSAPESHAETWKRRFRWPDYLQSNTEPTWWKWKDPEITQILSAQRFTPGILTFYAPILRQSVLVAISRKPKNRDFVTQGLEAADQSMVARIQRDTEFVAMNSMFRTKQQLDEEVKRLTKQRNDIDMKCEGWKSSVWMHKETVLDDLTLLLEHLKVRIVSFFYWVLIRGCVEGKGSHRRSSAWTVLTGYGGRSRPCTTSPARSLPRRVGSANSADRLEKDR